MPKLPNDIILKPLEVLTAKDLEKLVMNYAPAMNPNHLKNIISVVTSLAKVHGIMVVKADPYEYQNHLRFLTRINWKVDNARDD